MDWKNPDYHAILLARAERLTRIREAETAGQNPWPKLKAFYRDNPDRLCADWGMTFDPRMLDEGKPGIIPFIPFPKQVEFLKWIHERRLARERAVVEKSRECGVTWLCVAYAVNMWLHSDGAVILFGSRDEDTVDQQGNMDSIFEKVRFFVDLLPHELQPKDYIRKQHASHMKLINPENNSAIVGDAGDHVGRGGRASVAFVDESAFLKNPRAVENALSQNTNCQIDVSTFNGSGNLFYEKVKRWQHTKRHFIFDWKNDPRKDLAWYDWQVENLPEETVAQEIDRDPHASETDSFIPAKWVVAAIDAHKRLGFSGEGDRITGFDPADVGDAKAVVHRHGSVVTRAAQLTTGDITAALPWAMDEAAKHHSDVMYYDGDGMGAPAMKLFLQRRAPSRMKILPYHGSGAVRHPNRLDGATNTRNYKKFDIHKGAGKRNRDAYLNFRAQSYGWMRRRFELTYEAVTRAQNGMLVNFDPDDLISISSEGMEPEVLIQLQAETSRPQRHWTTNGKTKVESKADMKRRQVRSPNLTDAMVEAFSHEPKAAEQQGRGFMIKEQTIADAAVGY